MSYRAELNWCETMPPINVWVFFGAFTLIGVSFPIINIYMNTLYSTILGPRNQGTMQGIIKFSGCAARMVGPIGITWGIFCGTSETSSLEKATSCVGGGAPRFGCLHPRLVSLLQEDGPFAARNVIV